MTLCRSARGALGICVATLLLVSGSSIRPPVVHGQVSPGRAAAPEIRQGRHDTSGLLSTLPQIPPRAVGAVLRRKVLPNRVGSAGAPGDGALQTEALPASLPTGLQNFEGINNVNGVLPPDTTGDIGPNHYANGRSATPS